MTSDETRRRPRIETLTAITIAVIATPTAFLFEFDSNMMFTYWGMAFVACLLATWRARNGDGVDIADAIVFWMASVAGGVIVLVAVVVLIFSFGDVGFDLCSDDWQGGPDEDCF